MIPYRFHDSSTYDKYILFSTDLFVHDQYVQVSREMIVYLLHDVLKYDKYILFWTDMLVHDQYVQVVPRTC